MRNWNSGRTRLLKPDEPNDADNADLHADAYMDAD